MAASGLVNRHPHLIFNRVFEVQKLAQKAELLTEIHAFLE
jgi:hypothetical protein